MIVKLLWVKKVPAALAGFPAWFTYKFSRPVAFPAVKAGVGLGLSVQNVKAEKASSVTLRAYLLGFGGHVVPPVQSYLHYTLIFYNVKQTRVANVTFQI